MPAEAVFKAPLPFDFLQSDIPLRFIGKGVIADRLLSHSANLNVPSRREIERALRFYNYMVDVSGGKGSHQKWRGPDKRSFTVPVRDPISNVVFSTFLKHFEIDKETYLREVRPNL
jgi:predicted RNA binding protein YcfA (HicA-like mRNA interferase family)